MRSFKQVIAWAICVTMIAGMVGCKQNSPAKTDVQLPDTFMPSDISISEEDVAYEDNTLYADSQILLSVQSGTTYETVEKLVQKEEGIIIGFINFSGTYHIDFPGGKTYKELSSIISQWERKAYIEMASLNHVFSLSDDSIDYHGEEWLNTTNLAENGSMDWDESNPAGNNWWAEAIRMPSVWEMDIWESNDYSPINIGIIDSVFDEEHEDLDEVFEKIWYNQEGRKLLNSIHPEDEELISKKEHGTHVAGLIAAEMGNGCGIAGVASCAEPKLFGFSVHGASAQNVYVGVAHWLYAMALMFEENVKIINISQGLDDTLVYAAQKGNEAAKERISQYDEMLESFLSSAINAGYDFIIVKSSGNTSNDKFVSCDPTIENPYVYRKVKDGEKGESADCSAKYNLLTGISDSEVSARIVTVGAAEQSEIRNFFGYNRAEFSNLDCDVYAPGVNILSTIPGERDTKAMKGTSMATPIVSGIAALAWSVNPDLTGPQVKKIIVESYEEKLKDAITSNLIFTNPLDSLGSGINALAGRDLVMVVDAACVVNKAIKLRETAEIPIGDDGDECAIIGAVCYEITDENGDKQIHGIPEALVSLKPKIDESITFYEMPDDLGGFSNYYPEGEYTLRVTADGYEPFEQNIRLVKGEVLYLPISLIPLTQTPEDPASNTESGYTSFAEVINSIIQKINYNNFSTTQKELCRGNFFEVDGRKALVLMYYVPSGSNLNHGYYTGVWIQNDNGTISCLADQFIDEVDDPDDAFVTVSIRKIDGKMYLNPYARMTSNGKDISINKYYRIDDKLVLEYNLYSEAPYVSMGDGLKQHDESKSVYYLNQDQVDQSTFYSTQDKLNIRTYVLELNPEWSEGRPPQGYRFEELLVQLGEEVGSIPAETQGNQGSDENGFVGNDTADQLRRSIVGSWAEEGSVVSDYDFNSDGTCCWSVDKQTEGTYKIRDDKMLLITFPWMNDKYFWTEESYEEWHSHTSEKCWYMTESGVLILNGVSYYRDGKVIKDYNAEGGLLATISGTWILDDFMEYRFFVDGSFEENMVIVSDDKLLNRVDIDTGSIEIIDDTHARLWNLAESFGELSGYTELVFDPATDTLCIGGSSNVYHRAEYSD